MTPQEPQVSLREYFERVLEEKDKAINTALAAAKEAVSVAEANAQRWRENANEWRGAMQDREGSFTQKTEFNTYKEGMDKTMLDLKKQLDMISGRREGLNSGWGYLVGAIGIIITIVNFIK